MKHIKSIIFLLVINQIGTSQIDMLNEGLESCLKEDEFQYTNELFDELEAYTFSVLNVELYDYKELSNKFCQINKTGTFIISDTTELSNVIKQGINNGFWTFDKYEPNNKFIIDSDTIEIIPPGQSEYIPPPPESIEQAYVNSNNKYISCSEDYVFHLAMKVFFQHYETYKVAASMVKLCSMTEFFKDEDYKLSSIKHYILIHCVCQRIIHENEYYQYFKE